MGPHAAARALRSSRSQQLALIGPRRTHAYPEVQGALIYDVATAAEDLGYDLLLKTGVDDPESLARLAQSAVVDAILLSDVLLKDSRVDQLRALDFPTVLFGRTARSPGMSWVDFDIGGAGRVAVERLADLGHQVIGFLGPPASAYDQRAGYAVRCLQGARKAAAARGVHLVAPRTGEELDEFPAEVSGLVSSSPDVTGIVLQYEPATALITQLLASLGRRVPDDISVITIAPGVMASACQPPLDYIPLPLRAMAQFAVRAAVDLIETGRRSSLLIPPQFVEQASTRALSRGRRGRPSREDLLAWPRLGRSLGPVVLAGGDKGSCPPCPDVPARPEFDRGNGSQAR